MRPRTALLLLVAAGLALTASPLVGTAGAEMCRVGDANCIEHKVECVLPNPDHPTQPIVCTM